MRYFCLFTYEFIFNLSWNRNDIRMPRVKNLKNNEFTVNRENIKQTTAIALKADFLSKN